MKRVLFAVPGLALLLSAGTASADWLRLKVNVDPNIPDMTPVNQGGGGMGGMPGAGGMGGMPGGMRGMGMGGMRGMGMMGGMRGMGMMGGMRGMGMMGGMRGMAGGAGGGMGSGGYGMPGMGGPGSGSGGMPAGYMGGKGGPGMLGAPPPAAKDQGPWLYVYIEVHDLKDHGSSTYINHKWGKQGLLMDMKEFVSKELIVGHTKAQDFALDYKKYKQNAKDKNAAETLWQMANNALAWNLHKQFHQVMDDLIKLDPNTTKDYQANIKNYLRVRDALAKPPTADDPAVKAFTDQLQADNYKAFYSQTKNATFFVLYTRVPQAAKHKLALLQANLENFYYWFAMQKNVEQPPLPRTKMVAVMNDPTTFQHEQASWDVPAPVADGFTPRTDNVLFLSDERQDPAYARLSATLKPHIEERLQWFRSGTSGQISEDTLLNGKIWEDKRAAKMTQQIGEIQTMLILRKAMEEDAERATITHEGTRQLLVASGLFPRHVNVPEWVLSGLASYFETPVQAVYPGVGLPSWTHLVEFKHLQKTDMFGRPAEVLYNTLTDRYFVKARRDSEKAADHRDNDHLAEQAHASWELARSTAWAFVYHLASNERISELLAYGRELNQLPRDLELGEHALQGCAARAFKISDSRSAGRIDMKGKALTLSRAWFKQMEDLPLDLRTVEDFHTTMVGKQFTAKRRRRAPTTGANAPGNGPQGFKGPGGFNGPGSPMQPGGFKGPGVPPGGFNGPGSAPPGSTPPGLNGPGNNAPGNAPPPPPGGFKGPKGNSPMGQ